MFLNFEKYYGLYKAFDFSVTRHKMTNEGKLLITNWLSVLYKGKKKKTKNKKNKQTNKNSGLLFTNF